MIGALNHIAIAVPNLDEAMEKYAGPLGAKVGKPKDLIEHGVTVVFIDLPNTKIELISPLGKNSPILSFMKKNPAGGIHHICYEVESISNAISKLTKDGAMILGDSKPKIGAHGNPVIFLHPKDFNGTLIELEEVKS
ncbi:methylmalonyl-CoA epimerase [Amylibacter sp.]|jgi:methylmalonyl-CoA/ethylmalonyl-CoA epimerase|nr:methylmalonyl-CoA epimerase [Amylibacter sp.]MDA9074108.1 methylmalonyl-CoA epimerase [Amylibacter sp.]MDA9243585.1 methylmalonyl-CoA epimerase [Amylibacter sp.]MDA9313894.1 methylmalonyl-CoA epimerase [Amylibacter sp.]MDA9926771.1 methylmalonyl-CoA epimerase [Amylibacter sp.]|tara:strand:- start:14060 stop:14470 length:411 start_codon:yes stop_codon:yes gene_type:complete